MDRPRVVERRRGAALIRPAPPADFTFVPTGSKLLDLGLGGGWVRGRIANIVGDKSTGKTLLAMEACANFAVRYPTGRIYYRDAESAFDRHYARALGLPMDRIEFSHPRTVEEVHDDIAKILKRRRPSLIVVDSLDALSDLAELEHETLGEGYGARKAKLVSELLRRTATPLEQRSAMLMIVSQTRQRIGIFFGSPDMRAGGKALDFYASQVVWLHQRGRVTQTDKATGIKRVVGIDIRAKIDKNKVAAPFREIDMTLLFNYGIDDLEACCNWLKQAKALDRAGVPRDFTPYLRALMRNTNGDLEVVTAQIHRVLEQRWAEVETSFLPPRRKYGAK